MLKKLKIFSKITIKRTFNLKKKLKEKPTKAYLKVILVKLLLSLQTKKNVLTMFFVMYYTVIK